MPTVTWPYARPVPKRTAKSTQNRNTSGNSKDVNRPNRPERKHARKASSCGLHLSLSLLSAGARTIRLVPFPFPLGLRPSHPQSHKRRTSHLHLPPRIFPFAARSKGCADFPPRIRKATDPPIRRLAFLIGSRLPIRGPVAAQGFPLAPQHPFGGRASHPRPPFAF